MKHIQKFAEALLAMFTDGGDIDTAWTEAHNEMLHLGHNNGEPVVEMWENAWLALQNLDPEVWEVRPSGDLSSTDALYLSARATAQPENSKTEYRLTMSVGVSSTRNNWLLIQLHRRDDHSTKPKLIYEVQTPTFEVKNWDKVSQSQQSPEKVLRKFLEDFDAKGFALGSHSKVTSSRQFSPKFLKDLVSEIHHNAQKKFSGSDLEDMSDRNLPTQLDYLLSAYDPQHDSSADFAKAHTAEIADFFKMSGPEQAKALSGVFKGL